MGVDFFSNDCVIFYRVFTFSSVILVLFPSTPVSSRQSLTPYLGTKLVVYRDALIYLVPSFIVIQLYFCAFMAMYVFFTCHFFAIFLIPAILA